jgi:hypothetical protein
MCPRVGVGSRSIITYAHTLFKVTDDFSTQLHAAEPMHPAFIHQLTCVCLNLSCLHSTSYRPHPATLHTAPRQFEPLLAAATSAGFTLDVSNSGALAASLDSAVRSGDAYFNKLVRIMATRCGECTGDSRN